MIIVNIMLRVFTLIIGKVVFVVLRVQLFTTI